jgi:DUF1680 family protein
MALVELYRATGERRYLTLAQCFIDRRGRRVMRGHGTLGPEYHQDHLPLREVEEAAGHAVRQVYLAAGAADLYLETGERALFDAMGRLWEDIAGSKLFVTGGVGSRFDGESFGEPYELPSDQCYCETCAAIGSFMWNWRLLLATGDVRYADLMEQTLYNGILASRSLDGTHYFYVNPLQIRGGQYVRLSTNPEDGTGSANGRPEWHYVACCPPNVMRLLSSYAHYLATTSNEGVQIHQYADASIEAQLRDSSVQLSLHTEYPWTGAIEITVHETPEGPWTLWLRVPAWCSSYDVSVNGERSAGAGVRQGYIKLERSWRAGDKVKLNLDMEPRWILPNPRIDAIRDCVALQCGPIVYCVERQDQSEEVNLLDVVVDERQIPQVTWEPLLLGGVMAAQIAGGQRNMAAWQGQLYRAVGTVAESVTPMTLRAIPYFRWGNRGIEGMRVWLPRWSRA